MLRAQGSLPAESSMRESPCPWAQRFTSAGCYQLPDVLIFDGPLPTAFMPTPTITTSSKHRRQQHQKPRRCATCASSPLPTPTTRLCARPAQYMAHRAERTDCPAARLERTREHDTPSLAWFADVLLVVLPGREGEFRSFVSKDLWSWVGRSCGRAG
ncbi:hypothetical protein BJV78DRAFT_421409 [Lactifluus subvellereus]|nr:hypothetical protein BJV78DRAFT_421409 [Lactifluus subvellereus]